MKKKYHLDFLIDYYHDDTESMKTILELYLKETPKEIVSIEKALAQKDIATAKATTHKIKTNIAMLGIKETDAFVNAMHLIEPGDKISGDILKLFTGFQENIKAALAEIKSDFFGKI
ncbi:MAG: Hpt domain-containing protein [Chitinophagales bacterium]|nr:Hpt domain-containing protein [Chitinophagales bacterium]